MDRREGRRKRAREEEAAAVFEEVTSSSSSAAAAATAAVVGRGDKGKEEEEGEGWKRPPGVFEFPWQKCRGGLGVPVGGGGGGGGGGSWELPGRVLPVAGGRPGGGDRVPRRPPLPAAEQAGAVRRRGRVGSPPPARARWTPSGAPCSRRGPGPPHDANVSSPHGPRAHLAASSRQVHVFAVYADVAGKRG
ncbi:hypothetical protein OsJ_27796 [Oryza sativa Japonica Group]|uniref:Uncharacterized protein n=1 Tax=Oryza sativa subsp. japonica TaxID=39947 RepID=B9G1L2_ORYSJ|nr:hypothetical protein OsJ_27796 [Oryza sativa Japonica Group]